MKMTSEGFIPGYFLLNLSHLDLVSRSAERTSKQCGTKPALAIDAPAEPLHCHFKAPQAVNFEHNAF